MKKRKILLISIALITSLNISFAYDFNFDRSFELDIFESLDKLKGAKGGNSIRLDDVPAGSAGYLYSMSTGPLERVNMPAIFNITPNYNMKLKAGWGYSCGKFNAFSNIEAMLDQFTNKITELPQQLVSGAQSAVSALPAYFLNKVNASLYNVVTKNLDDAMGLFNIRIKSCKEIERDIMNGGNPYGDMLASMKNFSLSKKIENEGGTKTVDSITKEVDEDFVKDGVVSIGGKTKGGEGQEPLNHVKDVTIAGYNMLLGQSASNIDSTSPPTDPSMQENPLVKTYPSAEDAWLYLVDVYGQQVIGVAAADLPQQGPTGILKKVQERKLSHYKVLRDLVEKKIDRATYEAEAKIPAIPAEIIGMQQMDQYARDAALESISNREAVRDVRIRLEYLDNILRAGLQEPNILQSSNYQQFVDRVTTVRQEIMQDLNRIYYIEVQ